MFALTQAASISDNSLITARTAEISAAALTSHVLSYPDFYVFLSKLFPLKLTKLYNPKDLNLGLLKVSLRRL